MPKPGEKTQLKLFILYISVSICIFAILTVINSYITFKPINKLDFLVPTATALLVGFLMARNKALQIQLARMANIDKLTGIYNRQYFDRELLDEIDRAHRYKHFFSIMYLDLDHFKQVNDRFGHATGDLVLVEFANVVKSVNRESDIFARFGGEEFILLLQMADKASAQALYQRIKTAVDKYQFNKIKHLKFSAGIAEFNPERDTNTSLLERADKALYQAKNAGRNQSVIAD